jgi:hypothetical protein
MPFLRGRYGPRRQRELPQLLLVSACSFEVRAPALCPLAHGPAVGGREGAMEAVPAGPPPVLSKLKSYQAPVYWMGA